MKRLFIPIIAGLLIMLCSCSDDDYLNAIPQGSMALISIDMPKVAQENGSNTGILKDILHVDDVEKCGIDIKSKLYLFESPDGDLGLCARISDRGDAEEWMRNLAKEGLAKSPKQQRGCLFTAIKSSWVVGISESAMLVMGPAVGAAQAQMQQYMSRLLNLDEDQGIKGTPIYNKLDSINSPVAIVAQAQALPEKFVAPFTLGAPKDADASQVLIAADMEVKSGCLVINGETFSFNKEINKALHNAAKIYRPIRGKYTESMSKNALMGMFMNVDGNQFIKLLQTNRGLQALLTGINAAIDMNNIIKSVNGDMAIVLPSFSDDALSISMAAQLSNKNWLADVDYWKQSCPKGGRIENWGKDSYYYTDGSTSFYFGVTADNQFLSGDSRTSAEASIKPSPAPIGKNIQQQINGKRMCMVLNLNALSKNKNEVSAVTSMLKPLFGNINAIVYSIK